MSNFTWDLVAVEQMTKLDIVLLINRLQHKINSQQEDIDGLRKDVAYWQKDVAYWQSKFCEAMAKREEIIAG